MNITNDFRHVVDSTKRKIRNDFLIKSLDYGPSNTFQRMLYFIIVTVLTAIIASIFYFKNSNDSNDDNLNVEFLTGKIKSEPNGDYIDKIHEDWKGNYERLERHHGYIQWLFPIYTDGVNHRAQRLLPHEVEILKNSENRELVQQKILKSYELMLDFYGIQFKNRITGELERSDNYVNRYSNLIRNTHNNLRISRILECLQIFDLTFYQLEFIIFLINEVFETKELEQLSNSLAQYWIHTIKDENTKKEIIEFTKKLIKKND